MLNFKYILYAKSGDPDQTPRFAASDLVLNSSLMSHKKDAKIKWVKVIFKSFNWESLSLLMNDFI